MGAKIMIVAGEASGDVYGSSLASEIRILNPGVEISGVGGQKMEDAGVEILLDSNGLSVVGFWEAIIRIGKLRKALDYLKSQIDRLRPDLLILIDYPGMNLRLARFAKQRGVRVMYYVSPQIWAWGKNRTKLIKRNVDKMVVILPFEEEIYKKEGIDVAYVGHPLLDIVKTDLSREAFFQTLRVDSDRRLITLLPGSRMQEIRQHIRPLIETASILKRRFPSTAYTLVSLPAFLGVVTEEIRRAGEVIPVTTEHRYEALRYSDLAITCSGTATLEATLLGTPMIVIYRLAFFSWTLGKIIVKVPYISLANLVAGEQVVPEFLQRAVNPAALADEAASILTDDARRQRMIGQLERTRAKLGPGGATARAARLALSLAAQ